MINIYLCTTDRKNKILNDKAGSAGCLVCWQCMCGQPGYRWILVPGAPVAGIFHLLPIQRIRGSGFRGYLDPDPRS